MFFWFSDYYYIFQWGAFIKRYVTLNFHLRNKMKELNEIRQILQPIMRNKKLFSRTLIILLLESEMIKY